MSAYTCPECRLTNGWHFDEDVPVGEQPRPYRCPNRAKTEAEHKAAEIAKLANKNAWEAAQAVMRDVADTLPEFNANLIRDRFDTAGIPTSLRGSAFRWAAEQGLIEPTGERPMSNQPTTRHEISQWRSKVYRLVRDGSRAEAS